MNNFQIVNADTDSISFCKSEGSFIPLEERKALIKEINDLSPEFMQWADDGYYKKVIIVKAKNYVLQKENGDIIIKGSALKGSTKEKALQEFIKSIINTILNEEYNYVNIYNSYVQEILNVKDIKRWCTRKTLTDKVFNAKRSNEQKVLDAIKGTDYKEGDRAYFYFNTDDNLSLVEHYNNDYSKDRLLGKLFDTSQIFESVIDKKLFLNYTLKRNQKLLENFK